MLWHHHRKLPGLTVPLTGVAEAAGHLLSPPARAMPPQRCPLQPLVGWRPANAAVYLNIALILPHVVGSVAGLEISFDDPPAC
jgi:hypothetical protein